MSEEKEKYEQFDTGDNKLKEEKTEKKKKKIYKRIRNTLLFISIFLAIYLIYKKSNEVQNLQKAIEDEKLRREEEKNILKDSEVIDDNVGEKETIRKWINSEVPFKTKLLYRLSRDGASIFNFHSKCDRKSPTLLLIETHDRIKFGGYTTATWDMFKEDYKNGTKTFLFSLTKNKKYTRKTNMQYHGDIFSGSREIGPWFGKHDLYFYGTMNDLFTYTYSGECLFLDGNGLVERTSIDNSVGVKEVEMYQIIFNN